MAVTRLQKKTEETRNQQANNPEQPSIISASDSTASVSPSNQVLRTPEDQKIEKPTLPPAPIKAKKLRFGDEDITPVPFNLDAANSISETRPSLPNPKALFSKGLQYFVAPLGLAILGAVAAYLSGAAMLYVATTALLGYLCAGVCQKINLTIADRHFEQAKKENLINAEGTDLNIMNFTVLKKVFDNQNLIIAGQKGEQSWKEYIKDCVRLPRTFIPFSSASKYYHAGRIMERNAFEKRALETMSIDSLNQTDAPLSNKPC